MNEKELKIVKQGILNENEGYEFYKMAAKVAGADEAKKAFQLLAEEEMLHASYLRQLVQKFEEGDADVILAFLSNPPSPQIFKWENNPFKDTSLEVAVFGIAVKMELDSVDFYEKAKSQTEDEEAKKLYDILIDWEKVHYKQFKGALDDAKTEWFSKQGFAPF